MYKVGEKNFGGFFEAVAYAKSIGAEVLEIATGLCRWAPAPKKASKMRHVLVNTDGTETEFGKVRK